MAHPIGVWNLDTFNNLFREGKFAEAYAYREKTTGIPAPEEQKENIKKLSENQQEIIEWLPETTIKAAYDLRDYIINNKMFTEIKTPEEKKIAADIIRDIGRPKIISFTSKIYQKKWLPTTEELWHTIVSHFNL